MAIYSYYDLVYLGDADSAEEVKKLREEDRERVRDIRESMRSE